MTKILLITIYNRSKRRVIMKKWILTTLLALAVGAACACYVFYDWNEEEKTAVSPSIEAKAFQLGAFKTMESAQKTQKTYPASIIVKEDSFYRVYASILQKKEAIDKMQQYFLEKNMDTYLKTIYIDDHLEESLRQSEELIRAGASSSTYDTINAKILKEYSGAQI